MNDKGVIRVSFYFLLFLLLVVLIAILKYAWISADAPYYLATARDISSGLTLYKDIHNGYTPLVMVFFSYLFLFFENPPFELVMVVHIGATILTGFLLYRIYSQVKLNSLISGVLAIIFCIAILSSDGNYIVLETYCVLFVLLAVPFLLKDRGYLLAGILLGCSFLCKQYGVLNFVPFFGYILVREEQLSIRLKKCFALGIGGLIVFGMFIGYYTLLKNTDFIELLKQISGSGYSKVSIDKARSIFSILIGAKIFIVFVSILMVYLVRKGSVSKEFIFCIVGIVTGLIPVYLRGYQHYYISTFPYIFLAIGFILVSVDRNRVYIIITLLSALIAYGLLIARVVRYKDKKDEQLGIANIIRSNIPVGSQVFIKGELRYLYVLNDYKNPILKSIGYDYLFNDIGYVLEKQNCIVLSSERFEIGSVNPTEVKTQWGSVYIYQVK